MTKFDKKVGVNIAKRRKQLNLTRSELAEKSGHKESYIRSIECGVHKVGVCGLARIAYALQTNVDNLVSGVYYTLPGQDSLVSDQVFKVRIAAE